MTIERPLIYLVDDTENAMKLAYDLIQMAIPTADIRKAGNGLEALMLLEEQLPDLLITDKDMPILDGIGLIKEAREKYKGPIILASANDIHDMRKSVEQTVGVDSLITCLEKPYDIKTFRELVLNSLGIKPKSP